MQHSTTNATRIPIAQTAYSTILRPLCSFLSGRQANKQTNTKAAPLLHSIAEKGRLFCADVGGKRIFSCALPRAKGSAGAYPSTSSTAASGAFLRTLSMPFSQLALAL